MTSGMERLLWQQRELERILGMTRPELGMGASEMLLRQFRELERLRECYVLPTAYLETQKVVEAALGERPELERLRSLVSLELPLVQQMREQQERIDALVEKLGPETRAAGITQEVVRSLASTEAFLLTQGLPTPLVEIEIHSRIAFQTFAQAQLELASVASGLRRENLISAIEVGADLLPLFEPRMNLATEWWRDLEDQEIEAPEANLFWMLGAEVGRLDLEDELLDVEEAILGCSAAKVAELGGRIVSLVCKLNAEAEMEGRKHMFKPTNKGLRSTYVLGSHVASDEQSFGIVVDSLYFLLYEGSGDASRLMERVDEAQLKSLWSVKHLRTSYRHDVDHGGKGGIKKKNLQISEVFQELIGRPIPKCGEDWTIAQIGLYARLADMLDAIWLSE